MRITYDEAEKMIKYKDGWIHRRRFKRLVKKETLIDTELKDGACIDELEDIISKIYK